MSVQKYKIFIDGQAGTTGLQIYDRLQNHEQVEILSIAPEDRKNRDKKKLLMQQADVTFLCLPDEAAHEAAELAKEADCRLIDASSAHRCAQGWVYGLPELNATQREAIKNAQFVANPGCYATGAILLLAPLVQKGILAANSNVSITGVSGYSGGGNALISAYEEAEDPSSFGVYGLQLNHKHIPEIQMWAGLSKRPTFVPSVANLKQGMFVYFTLDQSELSQPVADLPEIYRNAYQGEQVVRFDESSLNYPERFKYIEGIENQNICEISSFLSEDKSQALVLAKLDNLGKGASGAAVQNMNIMLGLPEELGSTLS